MMTDMSTKSLESALAWRSAALEVTVCALWPSSAKRDEVEAALALAVSAGGAAGAATRVERSTATSPWFASVDSTVAGVDVLAKGLPALLQALLDQGAVAAWAGFEGSILGEQEAFSGELARDHYAVACGTTVALALDDEQRDSAAWQQTVAECRARLVRRIPSLAEA